MQWGYTLVAQKSGNATAVMVCASLLRSLSICQIQVRVRIMRIMRMSMRYK